MSFDWSEYLTLAQELANQAVNSPGRGAEAKFRCAISRAYYAAFGELQNHLRDKEGELVPDTARGHQMVVKLLKQSPNSTRQVMGQVLEDLRASRNMADYQNNIVNLPALTRGALAVAEQVISWLDTL